MNPTQLFLIDKPKAMTSFGVVARVRRICGVKKAGHAGTLDPLATGLMLVGVGAGTKQLTSLVKLDKEYVAEILIGQQRSTGDMEGVVVAEQEVLEIVSAETISSTLTSLVGAITLPVSGYSAIKVDGVPMYKRARAAEQAGTPIPTVLARAMHVYETELLSTRSIVIEKKNFQIANVRFAVGSGTYIRSLAEELGTRLGYPATLYSLRRTKVGDFDIKDAVTLEHLAAEHNTILF